MSSLNPNPSFGLAQRLEQRRQGLAKVNWRAWLIVGVVLSGALILGRRPSLIILGVFVGLIGLAVWLRYPLIGFPLLIFGALWVKADISTGTEVSLNPAALIVPGMTVIWLLIHLQNKDLSLPRSRTTRPLFLFLVAGLLSIVIGRVLWDPAVPVRGNFLLVQLGQWGLFLFSAAIFWITGSMLKSPAQLRWLTAIYLVVAGAMAIVRMIPAAREFTTTYTTYAVDRAPFWLLITAVCAGQLFFNQGLSGKWRLLLIAILAAVFMYSFGEKQDRTSNWVAVAVVISVLVWLRFPRIRLPVLALLMLLTVTGVFFNFIYQFAGGDAKWEESGGSRQVFIERVIEVTMRNPITGLGPAAYRQYARVEPLYYDGAYYLDPWVNTHNNYVDLFSQVGVLGLALLMWFMVELAALAVRLRRHYPDGFAAGYINSMLAAWAGIIVIMALADWFLPHVYNIGFVGFQASVLVWMLFGGLLTLEQSANQTQALT